MILDYAFNKYKRELGISYVTDNGGKKVLTFNVNRFKSYYSTPDGKFTNWDGSKCDIQWVDKPSTFDIKTYMEEMPDKYKQLLRKRTNPRLYTFDIETEVSNKFPEPTEAAYPITTISVASPECNVIILGTKELGGGGETEMTDLFHEYLNNAKYFKETGLSMPYIKYIKFDSERDMLEYFLKNIVSKVAVLAGWNSILFDWHYIQNRIRFKFPDLSLKMASCTNNVYPKHYKDKKDNNIQLMMPEHTLIIDMMDVIDQFDMVVMPIKDSLSLEYISSESVGMHKIKYKGDLQYLFDTDYPRYVFYNAIDSILVQMIDRRFKTMSNIYTQSLYCREKIGSCFSKIALTESLVFNYFYENGIKVVPGGHETPERGRLVGAYVKKPIPGKHRYTCCNDFSSLYPSTIITCNISFENYVGSFWKTDVLEEYMQEPGKYIVVGPNVYHNDGTSANPEQGRHIGIFIDEEALEPYRKDKNYFVTVNGDVYKNDKDYAFKVIQATLKANRNIGKYLSKDMDATVMLDIEHFQRGMSLEKRAYADNVIQALKGMGYDVTNSLDIPSIKDLARFKELVHDEITFQASYEQAMKYLGNSMYGGCSHVAFFWFNMNLANDITGEARNLIHMMEHHIPEFWRDNWVGMKDIHKAMGIEVDEKKAAQILDSCRVITEQDDPDAYHSKSFVTICYGDTDSLYTSYENLLKTIKGYDKMSTQDKLEVLVHLNTKFMDQHNEEFIDNYYTGRFVKSVHKFELETINLSGCWIDKKKRYAQILLWKEGKYFDMDNLPLKIKGLEMIKSSYPVCAREILKRMVRVLLEDNGDEGYLLQRLNMKMQEQKKIYLAADIEDICGNMNVNNYTKYIIDDSSPMGLKVAPKCPANVRALGTYNQIRNVNHLPGIPLYGGKMKYYMFYPKNTDRKRCPDPCYFAFQSMDYPEWAAQYAPEDRNCMFQFFVLDPFNRILNAIGIGELQNDGNIQMSLF